MRPVTSHFGVNRKTAATPISFPFRNAPQTFVEAGVNTPGMPQTDFHVASSANQPLIKGPQGSLFTKFKAPPNPMKEEKNKGFEAPPNVMYKRKEEIYNDLIQRAPTNEQKLAIEIARRQNIDAAVTADVNEDFTNSFNNWLLKRGRRQDHIAAGWWDANNPNKVPKFLEQGGLLSNHPSVHSYVKDIVLARTRFEQKLVEMKMEAKTAGVNHWPVDKLYLYYKYVVRGMEPDDEDLITLVNFGGGRPFAGGAGWAGGGAPAAPGGPGIPPPFAPAAPPAAPGKPPKATPPPTPPGKPGFFSRLTSALSSSSALSAAEYPDDDDPAPSRPASPPPAPASAEEAAVEQLEELDAQEQEEFERIERAKEKSRKRAAKEAAKEEAKAREAQEKADAEAKRKEEERQERQRHLDNVKKMRDLYEAGSFDTGDLLLEQITKAKWPHHGLYEIANAVDEAVKFRHEKERVQIEEWERKAAEQKKEAFLEEARKHSAPAPPETETYEKLSLGDFQSDRLFKQRSEGVEIPEDIHPPEKLAEMGNNLIHAAFHIEELVKEGKQEEAEKELSKFIHMPIDAAVHLEIWDRLQRDLADIVFPTKKPQPASSQEPESQKTSKNDQGEAEAEKPETPSQVVVEEEGEGPDVLAEEKKEHPESLDFYRDYLRSGAYEEDVEEAVRHYPEARRELISDYHNGRVTYLLNIPTAEITPEDEEEFAHYFKMKPTSPGWDQYDEETRGKIVELHKKYPDLVHAVVEEDDYPDDEPEPTGPSSPPREPSPGVSKPVVDEEHVRLRQMVADIRQNLQHGNIRQAASDLDNLKIQHVGGYEDIFDDIIDLTAEVRNASKPAPVPPSPTPATPKRPQATIEQITELYQTFVDKDKAKYDEELAKFEKLKAEYEKDVQILVGAEKERQAKEKKLRAKIDKLEGELGAALVNRDDPKVKADYARLQAENARLQEYTKRIAARFEEQKAKQAAYEAETNRLRDEFWKNQAWAKQKLVEIKKLEADKLDELKRVNYLEQMRNQQRQREAEQEHQRAMREKQVREAEAATLAKKIDFEAKLEETKLADAQAEVQRLMQRLREMPSGPFQSTSAKSMEKRLVAEIRKKQQHVDELKARIKETAQLQSDLARQASILNEQVKLEAPERKKNDLGVKRSTVERSLFASPDSSPMLGVEGLFDEEDADALLAEAHPFEYKRKDRSSAAFASQLNEAQMAQMRANRDYRPPNPLYPASSLDAPTLPQLRRSQRANRPILEQAMNNPSRLSSSFSGIGGGIPDARHVPRPTSAELRSQMRRRHKK